MLNSIGVQARPWPVKHGVPENPERSGYHWLKGDFWLPKLWYGHGVQRFDVFDQGALLTGYEYGGPCYSVADIAALDKAHDERVTGLLAATEKLVAEKRRLHANRNVEAHRVQALAAALADSLRGRLHDPEAIERAERIVASATETQCGYGMACVPISDLLALLVVASTAQAQQSSG